MLGGGRRRSWRCAFAAGALAALSWPVAYAKDSAGYVKEAQQYIIQGNLKAAEIQLRNAIREAPQDPLPRARLADVYLQLDDSLSAEREARAARERNGNEADYLPVLADALLRQEKFADLMDLVQPGDRDPVLESKVRTTLGVAAAGLHDQAKAEALLGEAIKLDPKAARPKIRLAWLLNGAKPAEADKLIDEAIAADPHAVEALHVKGEMLRIRSDQEGAMRLFDQVLKIDPNNILAHLSRANVNITLGKYKAADEDIDPILKASPDQFMANYLRGLELAKQQKYAEADRIFDSVTPGFTTFWPGYYAQGATKFRLGQYAQVEASLGKYLAHMPDDMEAARLIATAALQQHAPQRAVEYLKSLAEKMPADAATLTVLGNAYIADHKPNLALQQFQKAAALDPNNPTIETRVGISEIQAGQSEQRLAALEQVFGKEAGAPIAGPALVVAELRARQLDRAAEVAASLIERDAKNPVYHTLLGEVRAAQQDYPAAESALRAALAVDPDLTAATGDLAQIYIATGRIDEARNLYNDLLAKNPNEVGALLGLANTYIAQQKWNDAIDALNRARTVAQRSGARTQTGWRLRKASGLDQGQDRSGGARCAIPGECLYPRRRRASSARGWGYGRCSFQLQARLRACAEFCTDLVELPRRAQRREIFYRGPRGAPGSRRAPPTELILEGRTDPGRRRDNWRRCRGGQGARPSRERSREQHLRYRISRAL